MRSLKRRSCYSFWRLRDSQSRISGTAGAVVRVLFTSRNLVKSVVNRVTSDT